MGQLRLVSPSNVSSPRTARVRTGEANGRGGAKADGYEPGDLEPPLPLTPKRFELIKACAQNASRTTEPVAASRIAQRFAPQAKPAPPAGDPRLADHMSLTAPLSAVASGISRLTAVLIIAALLPNLTLVAFWLGLVEPPWMRPVTLSPAASRTPAPQSAIVSPVLSAPDTLEATGGRDVTFPIALDGTDGVPPGSIMVIRGLPHGSTLSSGRAEGETDWTLKPDEIGDLHLKLPVAASGEAPLTIQLVAPNNGILADAATTLKIAADPNSVVAADAGETGPAEAQVSETPDQEPGTADMVESAANAGPEMPPSDLPPLPIKRPEPGARDDGQANWVRPSAYVNLRESPSSSAAVISVVAKGVKLHVSGRQRGWVQVTNPETSQSGWIYSGNADTVR
jgi:Bacterial SH3 domain